MLKHTITTLLIKLCEIKLIAIGLGEIRNHDRALRLVCDSIINVCRSLRALCGACLSLLLVYAVLNTMAGMWGPFFSAAYDPGLMATSTFLAGAVNVVLGVPLVAALGVQGACLSSALAGLANWGLRAHRARRHMRVSFALARSLLLYVLLGMQAGLMVCGLSVWTVIACQAVFLVALSFLLRHEMAGGLKLVVKQLRR